MRQKILSIVWRLVSGRPALIVIIAAIITAVSIVFTLSTIRLDADLDHLVSEKLPYHKRYLDFVEDFGDQEYLYLVIEADGNLSKAKEFAAHFAKSFDGKKEIKEVIYKITNPHLEKSFLLFLPKDDLNELTQLVGRSDASLATVAEAGNAEGLFRLVAAQLENPRPEDEEKLRPLFSFFQQLLGSLTDTLEGGRPSFDLARLFFGSSRYDEEGFLVSGNGKFVFCLIMPHKDFQTIEVIEKPLNTIRQALKDTRREFPGTRAGLTGKPVLAADEIATTNRDMIRATVFAILAVSVIFILALRSLSSPLLAVIALLMGISWTYGLSTLLFGRLNILTIVFAIILVGAAIEYGIHMVTRCRQERAGGKSADEAVGLSLAAVGSANITSALTTAAAFVALTITRFTALAQLGFIAAVGIVFCLIAADLVLPAMLIIRERKRKSGVKIVPPIKLTFMLRIYRHWKWVSVAALILFAISVIAGRKVGFDHNLIKLQAEGLESVIYEHKLIYETDESSWFAVSFAPSVEASSALAKEFEKLPSVKRTEDISTVLPADQEEKRKIIKDKLAPAVERIKFTKRLGSEPMEIKKTVREIRIALEGLVEDAFSAGKIDAVTEIEKLTAELKRVEEIITPSSAGRLHEWENNLFAKLKDGVDLLRSSLSPPSVTIDDLPQVAKGRFIGKSGNYAVYIYPRHDIWVPAELAEFAADIRKIDPGVTGTPVEVLESGKLMEATFRRGAILAAIVVFVIAWIYFRSVAAGGWAILPLVMGIGWLLGLMRFTGLKFNLANFFAIPIILGVGIDSAIHIINRIRQEKSLVSVTEATGTGVLLTATTNVLGFGMLIIAHHRGIRSLGELMALGAFLCFIAAIVVLPPLVKRVFNP